jgi:thymidine kinase
MLTLVLGPMWSGKTFYCIRLARRYRAIGKSVLFVDHEDNNRYSRTHVVTHDGDKEECVFIKNLDDLVGDERYHRADVVIIEEAQFFDRLHDFVVRECDKNEKDFVVSGLSGDFFKRPIGEILTLIPHAEKVEKLNGFCNVCKDGTEGSFTKKKLDCKGNDEQILVGGAEIYQCVCREHHK